MDREWQPFGTNNALGDSFRSMNFLKDKNKRHGKACDM
jgi:hypothetical protein